MYPNEPIRIVTRGCRSISGHEVNKCSYVGQMVGMARSFVEVVLDETERQFDVYVSYQASKHP